MVQHSAHSPAADESTINTTGEMQLHHLSETCPNHCHKAAGHCFCDNLLALLPTCRFNYCPSDPSKQGATILALPKHKVYKGAPNFVYPVFSADQILAALNPAAGQAALNLGPSSFRQCQPAPPQTAKDARGAAAYFVCDVSAYRYMIYLAESGCPCVSTTAADCVTLC
jgi:hypothetical protein